MDAALVMTYRGVDPGREMEFVKFSAESDEFWARMVAEGRCGEPEIFLGLGNKGIWMVKGDYESLTGLLGMPEARRLFARLRTLLHEFDVDLMFADGAAEEFSGFWLEQVHRLVAGA